MSGMIWKSYDWDNKQSQSDWWNELFDFILKFHGLYAYILTMDCVTTIAMTMEAMGSSQDGVVTELVFSCKVL